MAAESERSDHSLAVFIDFENLALGFQGRRDRFDISRVLKRLVEKGKIVAKKAYADWNRYSGYTAALHECAIELIEIPHRNQSGKNSADIHLCVDAMDLAYSKDHIDTFVIVSGDSDFSPLVSKLKELGKHLIGLGMQGSTSELLRDNCDEFIYYEDLGEKVGEWKEIDPTLPEQKKKAFALLLDACLALRRENKQNMMSSVIKDTMKRLKPSFNETYHGYRTFSLLLEDAQKAGLIALETNPRSGTYVVTRFGDEMKSAPPPRRLHDGEERLARRPRSRATATRDLRENPSARRRTVDAAAAPRPRRDADLPPPDEADEPVRPIYSSRRSAPPAEAEPLPRRPVRTQPDVDPVPRRTPLEGEEGPGRRPLRRRPDPAPIQADTEAPPPPPERILRRPQPAMDMEPTRLPRRAHPPTEETPPAPAAPAPVQEAVPVEPTRSFGSGILD